MTHALHAEHVPDEFTAAAESFLAAALIDEGDDPPMRRRAQLENQARLFRRVLQLDAALERHGLFDKRGKLRVQWLTKLESMIGQMRAIDGLLGLNRMPKQIHQTPREWLESLPMKGANDDAEATHDDATASGDSEVAD